MQPLNPTLWRTCKMLSGLSRIRLLRELYHHPGNCVSDLAERIGLKQPAASQELRRIQSRGLLQSERQGARLIYRMAPDPQVPSAAPILKAIQSALAALPPERDSEMNAIAAGLAHERRIRIVRILLNGPWLRLDLQMEARIPAFPFQRHLHTLQTGGFVKTANGQVQLSIPPHPLAKALIRLIQQGAAR